MADFKSRTPIPLSGLPPAADGLPVKLLKPDSDFAEFRGVPLGDRILNVRIQYAAMRDLRAALAAGSGEVLGLILGSHSLQTLCIEGYEPVLLIDKSPDLAWLRTAIGRFSGGAPRMLGFFRTQFAGRPEFTRADSDIIRRHLPSLPENGGFFVVIETPRSTPWSAMLYAVDSAGLPASGECGLEFPFNENLLRKMFSSDFVPEFEPPRPREIPSAPRPGFDAAKRPSGVRIDAKNSRLWMAGVACAVGLLGIAALYNRYQSSARTRGEAGSVASYQPLGLKVVRLGADFEVSWDRTSNVIRLASDGTLTIRDGQITKIVNLGPAQLREGRILYSPLFRDLTVRFEISDAQRRIAGESVQVLGWDTSPSSGLLSSDLSIPPGNVAQSLPRLPAPAPIPARDGTNFTGLGANTTDPRVIQAPNVFDKQSQLLRSSPAANAPEAKALIAEARQPVSPQMAVHEPTPAPVAPAQTPAPAAEPAVLRPEPPAAQVPRPSVAPPVAAVAPPRAASQPAAAPQVVSPPAASQPAATEPAASKPIPSQPIPSQSISVTSNLQAAKLIKVVTPVYPSIARATRIQGTVRFNANIGGDGRIRKLQYTAGPSVLISAAAEAVKQWIYQPTLLNGQPIEVNTNIDVVFALK